MNPVRFLFLASSPPSLRFDLHLAREYREIKLQLSSLENSGDVAVQSYWAIRAGDLAGALLQERPDIIHLCGHGEEYGILLHDDSKNYRYMTIAAFAKLLVNLKLHAKLIFLSTCHRSSNLDRLLSVADYVVFFGGRIPDDSAIEFSNLFYHAVSGGMTVPEAFETARFASEISEDSPAQFAPGLLVSARLGTSHMPLIRTHAGNRRAARNLLFRTTKRYLIFVGIVGFVQFSLFAFYLRQQHLAHRSQQDVHALDYCSLLVAGQMISATLFTVVSVMYLKTHLFPNKSK
jgi:hypothetical protein